MSHYRILIYLSFKNTQKCLWTQSMYAINVRPPGEVSFSNVLLGCVTVFKWGRAGFFQTQGQCLCLDILCVGQVCCVLWDGMQVNEPANKWNMHPYECMMLLVNTIHSNWFIQKEKKARVLPNTILTYAYIRYCSHTFPCMLPWHGEKILTMKETSYNTDDSDDDSEMIMLTSRVLRQL